MELKISMGHKTHKQYKHTKFHQNPRSDPKFLVDLTWNDSYDTAHCDNDEFFTFICYLLGLGNIDIF